MRRLVTAGLLAWLLVWTAHAQTFSIGSAPAALASAVLGPEPGFASVAVWHDGKLGLATVRRTPGAASATPLAGNAAPLFEIGSISKVFTGVLLAQAVEKGELGLDDTLGNLLKGKVDFSSADVAAITLRQLMTHSSCLPRQFGSLRGGAAIVAQIREANRAALWAALASQKLPGKGPCPALYSNYGVAVVGEVLSDHFGKPWSVLVRDNIALPLGMADTVQHLGDKAPRFAPAFDGQLPTTAWDMDAFAGAGALRSTASDLVLFGRAILAGRNGPLAAAAERIVEPLGVYQGVQIGYAIFVRGTAAKRTYAHDGLTGGYQAQLMLAADTGDVVALLASNVQAPMGQTMLEVLASRYPVNSQAISMDAEQLRQYAGVYRVNPDLAFVCAVQDGKLYVRATRNGFKAYIPVGVDLFTRPAGGAQMRFVRDGNEVVSLQLDQVGSVTRARRTSEPVPEPALVAQDLAGAYAGRYVATHFLKSPIELEVRVEGGQMLVKGGNFPPTPAFPIPGKPDWFSAEVVPARVHFERDAGGKVSALILHQNGETRALRVTDSP